MGDRQVVDTVDQQLPSSPPLPPPPPPSKDDMISCVMALEAALLPCLPAKELQAIDRSPHPSHQIMNAPIINGEKRRVVKGPKTMSCICIYLDLVSLEFKYNSCGVTSNRAIVLKLAVSRRGSPC
ncbi:uncharacterized protein LOC127103980 isoform X2 [Lathyrus oleraceus]|uniref:uncharacterized protein LOC127103980 isoform X2 n=1 Tax=Pisum sativum TaxID=3888 RepID=UPI0021D31C6F|nr:uncharacterized protein LOC127103980 isoform X2 [Pisum sativum]